MTGEVSDLRKLQLEELEILKRFDEICKELGLRYYLLGGTLLGAVRHGGFIPWDDDVDICMPRPDYERFLKLPKEYFQEPYALYCYQNDRECRYSWARMVSHNMREINHMANKPRVEYAWIDIIPLDGFPNPGIKRTLHKLHLSFWWNLNQIIQFDELVDQHRKRSLIGGIAVRVAGCFKWMGKIVPYRICLERVNRVLASCPYESETRDVINYLAAFGFREVFTRDSLGPGIPYEFEGQLFVGPCDYDAVCTVIYGPDYLTPPPESDRNKHHAEIIKD